MTSSVPSVTLRSGPEESDGVLLEVTVEGVEVAEVGRRLLEAACRAVAIAAGPEKGPEARQAAGLVQQVVDQQPALGVGEQRGISGGGAAQVPVVAQQRGRGDPRH